MRRKNVIKTSYVPNEEQYHVFNKTWRYRQRIFQYGMATIMALLTLLLLAYKDYDFSFKYSIFLICFLLFSLFLDHNNMNYKKLLVNYNNKEIPPYETTFDDNNITIKVGKSEYEYDYSLVKQVIEGERLIVLKLPAALGIMVEKKDIDVDKLKELLLEKCNIKKINKVPKNIHLLKMIAWILTIVSFCTSLMLYLIH